MKDFYELFEIDSDADQEEIRRVTKEKLRNSHPDRSEDITPAQFEAIKTARKVLTDEDEREKYDELGHNRYVQNHLDSPLEGYTFTGDSGLSDTEGILGGSGPEDEMDELVSFNTEETTMDPTTGAVNQNQESGVSAKKGDNKGHAVEARKDRKDESGSQAAGILVTIGAIITNDYLQLGFLLLILLSVYYGVYYFLSPIGVPFAIGLSIGLFYFPVFRKVLTEPFE